MRPKRLKPEPADAGDPVQAEIVAMRYLARREYAARELQEKLVERGFDADAAAAAVDALRGQGLQDDRRFTEAFVSARVGRGHGPMRIAVELRRRGIPEDELETALAAAADWRALAAEVRRRRFGADKPADWEARAKQARFLEQRGFAHEHTRAALDDDGADGSG